ncbi:MAG: hypothetical protein HQL73_05855 [Magnetococcales bacterium]|nr:hypothetical protein [Magnetococcales bacterium]
MKRPRVASLKAWLRKRIHQSTQETRRSGLRTVSPLIVNLLLLPIVAFDLYGEVRSMLQAMNSAVGSPIGTGQGDNASGANAMKNQTDFVQMTQWHPFGGLTGPGAKIDAADTKNLPDTTLNMQLHGILFIKGTTIPAFALIKVADEKEKVFAIGDVLTGDVRLVQVQDDRVILDRGGHLETLKLPRGVLKIRDPDA